MRSYIRNGLRYRCWKKCFFVFKVWKAEAKRAKITALDTFWVSAYSSQVLVVLITKEFILNFEPVSWFRLEDCYISFPVSLNAKKEEKRSKGVCCSLYGKENKHSNEKSSRTLESIFYIKQKLRAQLEHKRRPNNIVSTQRVKETEKICQTTGLYSQRY